MCASFMGFADKVNSPFQPGLEAFVASNWAKENNKDIIFSGKVFNKSVISHLERTSGMYLLPFLYRMSRSYNEGVYKREKYSQDTLVSTLGAKDYSEIVDDKLINWWIALLNRIAPEQKTIFIDNEDERLFNIIYNKMEGKRIFALVNQWHLPGIERFWRLQTDTVEKKEEINPIGDFDINKALENDLQNEVLRRMKSKAARSEPATTNNVLFFYNKSQFEGERERHVFFEGYDDPELEHGLYNGENDKVKNLPYKKQSHH